MAPGQFLPELGPGGEVGGELLAEGHRPAIGVFTVLGTAQNLVHAPHPIVGPRLPRPFLFGGGRFLGRLGVILDHLVQEVLLLRAQLLLARELFDGRFGRDRLDGLAGTLVEEAFMFVGGLQRPVALGQLVALPFDDEALLFRPDQAPGRADHAGDQGQQDQRRCRAPARLFRRTNLRKRYQGDGGHAWTGSSAR